MLIAILGEAVAQHQKKKTFFEVSDDVFSKTVG